MEAKGFMVTLSYRKIALMTAAKIGEGGCGTVFMDRVGNTPVAVKRLIEDNSRVEQEFLQEVESIGTIHHIHLVSLLATVPTGTRRYLSTSVERGSLDRVLFRAEEHGPLQVLDWRSQFAIAIQTALGLAYLHEDCKQRILHCDVKPENFLLDSAYSAKVGLSHILSRKQTRTVTSNNRGTTGYLTPERTYNQVAITSKTVVFSYGIGHDPSMGTPGDPDHGPFTERRVLSCKNAIRHCQKEETLGETREKLGIPEKISPSELDFVGRSLPRKLRKTASTSPNSGWIRRSRVWITGPTHTRTMPLPHMGIPKTRHGRTHGDGESGIGFGPPGGAAGAEGGVLVHQREDASAPVHERGGADAARPAPHPAPRAHILG